MTNKKVIRKSNEHGKFTTVHNSILFDTRLTPMAFRILTIILSDADHFNLTRELIVNRLGIDKKTVQAAFKNLENAGYMRRTQLNRGYFYTISDFGNLNVDTSSEIPQVAEITNEVIEEVAPVTIVPINIHDHVSDIIQVLPENFTNDEMMTLLDYLTDAIDEGRLTDKSQLSISNLQKVANKLFPPRPKIDKTKFITQLCEEFGGGIRITIANKAEITKKVLRCFENFDGEISEKLVRSRILSVKTAYQSTGHLDQRFQN
ncbi:helix-turn-helix domain-containing protein [Flavobacterium sp.]|uniref:helix-turn-helix domain-containing protein n=1 Tax=Flavobacterium sp. TaxID=239 RepID=UPI0025C15221|nr:helix-turn-helix domain-containing protein [Flavobacterium sp.]